MIPTFFGVTFLVFFILQIAPDGPFENVWAGSSKLMMLITGLIYCVLCILSFRFARKNRTQSS